MSTTCTPNTLATASRSTLSVPKTGMLSLLFVLMRDFVRWLTAKYVPLKKKQPLTDNILHRHLDELDHLLYWLILLAKLRVLLVTIETLSIRHRHHFCLSINAVPRHLLATSTTGSLF